jgi:hypothetical protein
MMQERSLAWVDADGDRGRVSTDGIGERVIAMIEVGEASSSSSDGYDVGVFINTEQAAALIVWLIARIEEVDNA